MGRIHRIHVESPVAADPEVVWAHATSMRGINLELSPLHMSAPPSAELGPGVPIGRPLFVSRVSLAGVVPVDLHELTLASFEPGRGFHERSRSLLMARWIHRRTLHPLSGGTLVEDDVTFEPKLPGLLVVSAVRLVFARRHRALRRELGTLPGTRPVLVESLPPRVEDVGPWPSPARG